MSYHLNKANMNVYQIIFSPTGGTGRVSEILCHGMCKESIVTDLCVKADDIQLPDINEDDLAVIAMPVFAGRVPATAPTMMRCWNCRMLHRRWGSV